MVFHPLFQMVNDMFSLVLVNSGCCNKVPYSGWLRESRHLFLTVLEALAWMRSGEDPFLVCRWLTPHCVLTWPKESKLALWPLLLRALISFMRAPPSWPNDLQRPYLQIPSHWGLDSTYECWGDANIQSISFPNLPPCYPLSLPSITQKEGKTE